MVVVAESAAVADTAAAAAEVAAAAVTTKIINTSVFNIFKSFPENGEDFFIFSIP